ncbi:MAG: hypothetical protein R2880_12560 [Deinococcales bacterium]
MEDNQEQTNEDQERGHKEGASHISKTKTVMGALGAAAAAYAAQKVYEHHQEQKEKQEES